MTIISKYVALKNYIPIGLPKEEDFEIRSKTLESVSYTHLRAHET